MKSIVSAHINTPRRQWRNRFLSIFLTVTFLLPICAHSTLVDWTNTLDATRIATSGSVIYTDVNSEGYDIVITTSNLHSEGGGGFGGLIPSQTSWWAEGNVNSLGTVTFRFYKTGTFEPVGIMGTHFRFEDAESNELFANFAYWNALGELQDILPNTSPVFTGSTPAGLNPNRPANILENLAPLAGGTQLGKSLDVNLSSYEISGFTFDLYRTTSGAGSVEMSALGDLQMIPEPQTLLFGIAILGVVVFSRRRLLSLAR
jgi:hypothetical protein